MTFYKPRIATVAPPTLQKQIEVLAAARALLGQEDAAVRRRREEIAALRRDLDELRQSLGAIRHRVESEVRSDVLRMLKYNVDQPRVPAGEHGGGRWTSGGGAATNDAGNARASEAARRPERGPQYAQATPATRSDATDDGGNVSATAAQQYPYSFPHELFNVTVALIHDTFPDIFGHRDNIWSWQIPAESAKRPVWLVDDVGQPILDGRGNQLVGPHDLPPETYVQAGLDAKSRGLAGKMHELAEDIKELTQAFRGEGNTTLFSEDDSRSIGTLMSLVAYKLLPFVHAGSFDAERFENFYVRDYRPYTSVALGIYMAAAGVSRDDALTIADFYAAVFSRFHEDMDPNYPHSTKQDIQDNLLGYELYESGRIRHKN